jgi:dTDP-4-amino-4,6-dideoxygalactose transaminase
LRFADIRPDTLNVDERLLEAHITPRTRVIAVVHYAGVGCEMDAILALAARHEGLAVIEDNAHGLFGRYRGRPLGGFGAMSTLSFHETKNISCGEGGALAMNDPRHAARAVILADKGTDRQRFLRGEVDRYTWVDTGSSYLPSEILAAVLYAQLEARERIQRTRRRIWRTYESSLADWAAANGVRLPVVPEHCEPSAHQFHLILPAAADRARFLDALAARGIRAVFHYQPLHTSKMGREFGGRPGDCPVAEMAGDRLVRLPFHNGLTTGEQDRVVDAVRSHRL